MGEYHSPSAGELLAALETAGRGLELDLIRACHAGLLLCAFREPDALPVFDQVFRDPDRESLLEWFEQDLPVAAGASTSTAAARDAEPGQART